MGYLFDKFGPRWLLIPGIVTMTVTVFLFRSLDPNTSPLTIVILHTLLMVSVAMVMMPAQTNGLNQLPALPVSPRRGDRQHPDAILRRHRNRVVRHHHDPGTAALHGRTSRRGRMRRPPWLRASSRPSPSDSSWRASSP